MGINMGSVNNHRIFATVIMLSPIRSQRVQQRKITGLAIATGVTAFTAASVGATLWCYKISRPDQYLVRTGLGFKDISVKKNGFVIPGFQKHSFLNMIPGNYKFNLDAMSSQKMEFILPGVFTIGPRDEINALRNFSRYLSSEDCDTEELVRGIIEGGTRDLAAGMTIEEIFSDRAKFKIEIIDKIQRELDQFGLQIFNANIKELRDAPGSEYFLYMRQKTRSEAEGKAKVDIAEAEKNANIGEKQRLTTTRMKNSTFEAEAVKIENENKQRIAESNAALGEVKAESDRRINTASIESVASVDKRNAEVRYLVEQENRKKETERLRAINLSKTVVDAEIKVKEAEGTAKSIEQLADAELYRREKEGDGIKAIYESQAEGIEDLIKSFNGDNDTLMKYLFMESNMYEKLAKQNAEAIRGLSPKITIWNTGSDENDYTKTIAGVVKSLPPLFSTIHDQTGLKPSGLINGFKNLE